MEDWDLYAVVRGCTPAVASSISTAESTDSSDQLISSIADQGCIFPAHAAVGRCFQDLFSPPWEESQAEQDQELHQLYKPFIFKSPECSHIPTISPLPVLVGLSDPAHEQPPVAKQTPQQAQAKQKQQPFSYNSSPRSKKRKIHQKRVCHVSAENLSSDIWSWRKYGQKPIKGSPYPRGYYRCSTSKGCLARKQVERDRTDPGMFIVTFTAEHNHPMPTNRNSLAGSTRHKPAETPNPDDSAKVPASTEKVDNDSSREDPPDDEDDLENDFFAGLEGFRDGECTSGHFPAGVELSWLSSSTTTTTAGGG